MAERPHGNQGDFKAGDRPLRRAKKPAFCFQCGKTGHTDDDCPEGVQTRETASYEADDSSLSSTQNSSNSSERECPAGESTSSAGPQRPITYSRPAGKKTKALKPVEHEDLKRLYDTGEQSRNPVGANFANCSNDVVNVSDDTFHNLRVETFEDLELHEDILGMVKKLQYETPLPVQKYAFSIINSGRNLKASARTGCGKTAAFLLPILNYINRHDARVEKKLPQYPKALIISPTRELAQQIYTDATKFAARTDIKICLCHGEAFRSSETQKIESGTNILIGTLGRTVDHLRRRNVKLDKLRFLVFDEADRIMDEDFAAEIEEFMEFVRAAPSPPQTLMFSATFAERIMSKIDSLFTDHVFLRVGILGTVNEDVQQNVLLVHERDKKDRLLEIIQEEQPSGVKTLIFVRSRERAQMLEDFFFKNKIKVAVLHAERDQYERTKSLRDFNDGVRTVMVATLLANRGLDVSAVNHVINYDLPGTIDQYVNCLGRTGRVGNSGRATSFFDPNHRDDKRIALALRKKLQDAGMTDIPAFLECE